MMLCLTLKQPFASLIVCGEKRIETRSWRTRHAGRIAIHASARWDHDFLDLCDEPEFREALARHNLRAGTLPLGAVLGTVELVACLPSEQLRPALIENQQGKVRVAMLDGTEVAMDADKELAFGDYSPRRWGWLLREPRPLRRPVPCKGCLQLWDVPEHVLRQMELEEAPSRR